MDTAGVDAIVYPGFRIDVYDNDGAQTISSDRNSGVPTSNVGLPTLILPVGANPHGDPMSLQFVGPRVGRREGARLRLRARAAARRRGPPRAGDRSAAAVRDRGDRPGRRPGPGDARRSRSALRPRSARSRRASTRTTRRRATANVISTAGDAALSVSDPGHLMNGTFALPSPLEVDVQQGELDRAGLQRPGHDRVQAARRRHRRAAHRHVLQDADVHVVDDDAVAVAMDRRRL